MNRFTDTLIRLLTELNRRDVAQELHKSPESRVTPLGHVPFRVINPDASLEAGIERAKQVKCYQPHVEVEE